MHQSRPFCTSWAQIGQISSSHREWLLLVRSSRGASCSKLSAWAVTFSVVTLAPAHYDFTFRGLRASPGQCLPGLRTGWISVAFVWQLCWDLTPFADCNCPHSPVWHIWSRYSYNRGKGPSSLHWNRKPRISEVRKNPCQSSRISEKRTSFGRESLSLRSLICKTRTIIPTLRITVEIRVTYVKCPA